MPDITEATPDKQPWFPHGQPKMLALNLQTIVNEISVHGVVRAIAADLILNTQYKSTGAIFYALNNLAVADLFTMALTFEEDFAEYLANTSGIQNYNIRNLSLLTMLLARAEGLSEISADTMRIGLPELVKLIQHESKYRKGIIKSVDYLEYTIFDEQVEPNFSSQFK